MSDCVSKKVSILVAESKEEIKCILKKILTSFNTEVDAVCGGTPANVAVTLKKYDLLYINVKETNFKKEFIEVTEDILRNNPQLIVIFVYDRYDNIEEITKKIEASNKIKNYELFQIPIDMINDISAHVSDIKMSKVEDYRAQQMKLMEKR